MFCFQCEETTNGTGCSKAGICGKNEEVSNLEDLLVYLMKGTAYRLIAANRDGKANGGAVFTLIKGLFSTITNVNFDANSVALLIEEALELRNSFELKPIAGQKEIPDCAKWEPSERSLKNYLEKAEKVGIKNPADDAVSLSELLLYGLKGMAAYAYHAYKLGQTDEGVGEFIPRALAAIATDEPEKIDQSKLLSLIFECGEKGVSVMKLLDGANTARFGIPRPTPVLNGTKKGKAILISGHDLLELEELLKQTENTDIQVYTHSEMLPAHGYPELKKYKNLNGNYGGAWWDQRKEFENFNGPIVMTTNCIQKPTEKYKNRIFTTDLVAMPGVKHISNHDFSEVIKLAESMDGNSENTGREINTGFGHDTLTGAADKIIELVKDGKIKKFVVMAGCDGREKNRDYYSDLAKELPNDTLILTSGCAKYRFNRLELGDVAGFPKVIDAGQCNDSYSLAVIALTLKEKLGLKDINDLPVFYEIAWYEQKAVLVLLALLYLGVKNIRLGMNLPAFLSDNVKGLLIEKFNIMGVSSKEESLAFMN